jgi:hypothetical protein
VSVEDERQSVCAGPGGVDAQKAPGGDKKGGRQYQVLKICRKRRDPEYDGFMNCTRFLLLHTFLIMFHKV